MSDEFDKEAEREKLREKFADDDEKREHTQRMSELLLKGATMTNRHCDDCGDPIFRQDGREFCPTCHTVDAADVQGGGAAETAGREAESPQPASSTETREPNRPTEPSRSNRPKSAESNGSASSSPTGVDDGVGSRGVDEGVGSRGVDEGVGSRGVDEGVGSRGVNEGIDSRDGVGGADAFDSSEPAANATSPPTSGRAGDTPPGGVDDARGSLVRTLTRFARAAEATDDPRRAREHLRAAREAAETLAALDR